MKKGLYIGRFQPFHLGHLSAIKQALKQADSLYIGIGSSQYSKEPENPYTGKERMEMIEAALKEHGLEEDCEVFLVPDIHDDDKWAEHVRGIVPEFEAVFLGNEDLVKQLFEEDGTPIVMVDHELDISATDIRKEMEKGDSWKKQVSKSVADYLERLGHR